MGPPDPAQTWVVRPVTGAAATKTYRCAGCEQEVPVGTPHVVVWPDEQHGVAHRRHWHSPCWAARERRRPNTLRSRNAPRH